MIKYIIIGLVTFFSISLFSQNMHFGYPSDFNNIKRGDTLIISMPPHNDGRFNTSNNLDSLNTFLNVKKDFTVKVEINIFITFSLSERNMTYSNTLLYSLDTYLKNYKIANYTLISNGDTKPIYPKVKCKKYTRDEKLIYNKKNTYLKLIVL